MTCTEVAQLQQDNPEALQLVDVREPWELEICRIEGSLSIPMNAIPAAIQDLKAIRDRRLVFICHHGIRSQHVAQYLMRHGIPEAINLEGGMDAWAQWVDPSMARY